MRARDWLRTRCPPLNRWVNVCLFNPSIILLNPDHPGGILHWSAVFLISNIVVLHYINFRLQRTLISKQNSLWVKLKSLGCLFTIWAIIIWRELVLKCCLPHFEIRCPPLHWSSITENITFKAEFTLSSSSVKVGFTGITISILEKSR